MKAEYFFNSYLNKLGINYTFVDDWYDYVIEGIKVELKSCQMTLKQAGKYGEKRDGFRIGRFDFTDADSRIRQASEDIWIALLVRHKEQFIIYGFIKSVQTKGKRYLSIHKARSLKPLTIEEWLIEIEKEKKTD